mmetsp:Transcript_11351/g.32689  ORF Transcript_11351/g.32689 Transcript_11351/m.32689 type:complete len:903 (+) Transcript_11351:231-2939(+)
MGAPKNAAGGQDSNKVRVVGRIRPLAKYEIENGSKEVVARVPGYSEGGPETLQIDETDDGNANRYFELDAVLGGECSQKDVYEKSGARKAIADDLFCGYNATILAYGQTGAGKTYTMGTAQSNDESDDVNDGVIPRACRDLFENVADKCDGHAKVECSYMEVYNEEIRDLLVESGGKKQDLRIRETLDGQIYVRGITEREVKSPLEVYKIMEEANKRRVVASTKMNATSSRSHAICVLRIKGVVIFADENNDANADDGVSRKFEAKLTLVDLAGSERLKKTGAQGGRAKEGISINKGLFVLGQVVSALSERGRILKQIEEQKQNNNPRKRKILPPRKPPYRDSKLTRLLQDSLGGNSRTIMIACVSPANFNVEETINTLRYATQARNISNTATANLVETISQEEARKLKRENTLMKTQIAELEATIAKLTQDVTPEDLERSISMIEMEKNDFQADRVRRQKNRSLSPVRPAKEATTDELLDLPLDDHHSDHDFSYHDQPNDDDDDKSKMSSRNSDATVKTTNETMPKARTLEDHFRQSNDSSGSEDQDPEEEMDAVSQLPDDMFSVASRSVSGRSMRRIGSLRLGSTRGMGDQGSVASTRTIEDLEDENMELEARLLLAERDVRATVRDTAVTLPALKKRVKQLEDNLNESKWLETEAFKLQEELNEARADKESALRAAQQLTEFMNQQKLETGFQGDELVKERINYCRHKLNEDWVKFVVVVLNFFKEEMRLLGDYFHMVVKVVESPDILGMLGMLNNREREHVRNAGVGWWKSKEQKEKEITALEAEKKLRNDLLREHISFFNSRLVEIEDDVNYRSESLDIVLEELCGESQMLEAELVSVEEVSSVREFFSEKGQKLVKELTTLMTTAKPVEAKKEESTDDEEEKEEVDEEIHEGVVAA